MKQICPVAIAMILMAIHNLCEGATDGHHDGASAGAIEISLAVLPSIQVSAIDNIVLRIADRTVDAIYSEPFCLQGNRDTRYTIVAWGSHGTDRTFQLDSATGDALGYHVSYRGDPAAAWDELEPGVASPAYVLRNECTTATNFMVRFRADDLAKASAGYYTGHLTLVVSPV